MVGNSVTWLAAIQDEVRSVFSRGWLPQDVVSNVISRGWLRYKTRCAMSLVEVAAIQDVVGNSVTWLAAIQDEVRSVISRGWLPQDVVSNVISRGSCDTRCGWQCHTLVLARRNGFSDLLSEIAENDYNLNIPRYVDTFEEEEAVNLKAVSKELKKLEVEMKSTDATIEKFCKELGIDSPF